MQTFLPFKDYLDSAKTLDKRRCFKQVVEARQILNILDGKSEGWKNHPAVKMWRGYRDSLVEYYNVFYKYCRDVHKIKFNKLSLYDGVGHILVHTDEKPKWLTDEFCQSHRNNLARKAQTNAELRANMIKMGIDVDACDVNGPYLWPVN